MASTLTLRAISLNDRPITQPIAATFGVEGGSVGRADSNTLSLPDPERRISRRQAEVLPSGSDFTIKNVGSANPIIVRDKSLALGESAKLEHGDQVRIGGYLLEVSCGARGDEPTAVDPSAVVRADPFAVHAPALPPRQVATPAHPRAPVPAFPASSSLADVGSTGSAANPFADMMRSSLRAGGAWISLAFREPAERHRPIVAICDISGSMSDYTRLFLHFLHAVTDARKRVTTFLFGTRLTNVTRAIRQRDPDEALAACSANVADWSGGTRIATSLHTFNKQWARRVLTQGAVVLLITDGLERDADDTLAFEIDRLHRSCRRLIWLNPLLRFHGFEARAKGVQTMLPHVDELRPIHNLKSITDLVRALSGASVKDFDPKHMLRQVA